MTVKTTSRINSESIEVTLTQREIAQLAHDKLIKERPDLKDKPSVTHIIIGDLFSFMSGGSVVVKVDVHL